MRATLRCPAEAWPSTAWLFFIVFVLASVTLIASPLFADEATPLSVISASSTTGNQATAEATPEPAGSASVISSDAAPPEPQGSITIVSDSSQPPKAPTSPSADALEPVPEAPVGPPPKVHTASFNGVTPGKSTRQDVVKQWGPPVKTTKQEGLEVHRYAMQPFDQIEVVFSGNKVASIIVRLQKAFPAKAVAQQLRMSNIRPVLVSNELGDILGQSYPERGVLFAFKQNHKSGSPSMQVTEIVLEPVSADSFVLRAETNLQSNFKQNLHDLDEAIKLSPNQARAHWLRSRVLAAMGQTAEAVEASGRVIELEPNNARYHVTHAQILDQAGDHEGAIAQTAKAIKMSEKRPHVKARAQCLMGNLLGNGPEPNWPSALKFHMAAIKTADPLAVDRHPAIRLAAKEVMIDAHLGAANDIAWGRWGDKEKAVAEWTRRAAAFAEELIANDGGTDEHRFRVASRSLAAIVGVEGKMDPTEWVKETVSVGTKMIGDAADKDEKHQLSWELGMALFNAVQIYQSRKEYDFALECGREATRYFTPVDEQTPLLADQCYTLGRLYFRLGAIHALNRKDPAAAVVWYDKAEPLLRNPMSSKPNDEWGRHGETLVSMAVSYWETGQHRKAIRVTHRGLELMKQAVAIGAMPKNALSVPYENLAAMQRHLGNAREAANMERLAADAKVIRSSRINSTAKKPTDTVLR